MPRKITPYTYVSLCRVKPKQQALLEQYKTRDILQSSAYEDEKTNSNAHTSLAADIRISKLIIAALESNINEATRFENNLEKEKDWDLTYHKSNIVTKFINNESNYNDIAQAEGCKTLKAAINLVSQSIERIANE